MAISRKKEDFLKYVRNFIQCEKVLADKWQSISQRMSLWDTVRPIDLPMQSFGTIDKSLQQINVKGEIICDITELFWVAAIAKKAFDEILYEIVNDSGLEPGCLITTPLKSHESAIDKSGFNYGTRQPGPSISWLYDVVRASIICDTEEEICAVLECFQCYETLAIVRLKNRFQFATPCGYRDILVNMKLDIGNGIYHICEIQIHLRSMFDCGIKASSHSIFEYFRTYFRSCDYAVSLEDIVLRKHLLHLALSWNSVQDIQAVIDDAIDRKSMPTFDPLQQIMRRMGEYTLAEKIQRHVVAVVTSSGSSGNGEDNEAVLLALHGLMIILENQNAFAEAEDICRRLVLGREALFGRNDARTIKIVNNLALLLQRQNKLDEAEKYFFKSLEGKARLFGPLHQSTLSTMDSLADVLKTQEKFSDAEIICQRALQAREVLLGPEHAMTVSSMNNLAVMKKRLGALSEAEALFRKIHAIKLKTLGAENPSTLTTLDNIAAVHEDLRDYSAAQTIYASNLAVRQQILGENHLDTIQTMMNLGSTFSRQGKNAKAAEVYFRACLAYDVALGREHVKTKKAEAKARHSLEINNKNIVIITPEDARIHIDINVAGPGDGREFIKAARCENCDLEYTVLFREHHCRVCARSVCGKCSPSSTIVPGMHRTNKHRVCAKCFLATQLYPKNGELSISSHDNPHIEA